MPLGFRRGSAAHRGVDAIGAADEFRSYFPSSRGLFELFVCSGFLASLSYGASLTYRSRGAEGVAHFAYLFASQLVAFLAYMVAKKLSEGFLIARLSNYWPQSR